MDWCSVLGIAESSEGGSYDGAFFAVDKKGSHFGFTGRGGNMAEDTGGIKDGSIEVGGNLVVSKVEVAPNPASCFGSVQVACVTVNA